MLIDKHTIDMKKIPPIHPGEILRDELLIPLNISHAELAQAIGVSKELIEWICEERINLNPDICARLSYYFDFSPNYWINLQKSYEEKLVSYKIDEVKKIITPYAYGENRKSQ